ncbi:DinB family protein [Nostocoides sp. HKS02]|uniref:DinB family protein n=1 Tax=Nostocoides sp. HKS02 TaxID=1813880 RepID=UPI0012B4BFCA|nr:DinB family protein [Tetrasphaera sp. HKS02]QGN57349.1 DUF664 domain-containing protein [Tetrasphaera sp. HKS02]
MVALALCSLNAVSAISSHDPAILAAPLRVQLESFLDDHREALCESLDGITEEEARRQLVPSKTTLLGLVKHASFVELVWFNEAITGRSRAEIGCPDDPDASFTVEPQDTIDSVRDTYRDTCRASRTASAPLGLDDLVHGNRRGPLPMRWVYLHVLRELAQHCGHADILREQLLAAREGVTGLP